MSNISDTLSLPFTPFFLLTSNLLILPTPTAHALPAYRALYARLHADPAFCTMGFGPHFPARSWSDDETHEVILTRDVHRNWDTRRMGDFAVGVLPDALSARVEELGRCLDAGAASGAQTKRQGIRLVEGEQYEELLKMVGSGFAEVQWVGYAGVRDATTTSIPVRVADDAAIAALSPWEEMVELRYGVAPEVWGKGVAGRAAEAVMLWAVRERGVRRFIAETERENMRSGRVLGKLGFRLSGTDYWRVESEVEWERIIDEGLKIDGEV